jgi:integrase
MKLASPRPARTFLELDELADLLDAASAMDRGESDKTQQVRALADSGKKPADIAAALEIAVPTVYYHLAKAQPCAGRPRRAVVSTLGYAGLRIGELCDLRRRSLRLHVGRFDVEDAKTPTGVREVDLTPVLRDELVAHRAWMVGEGMDVSPDALVFQTADGQPQTPSNVRRLLRVLRQRTNARREAGGLNPLPHVTPHILRRTYISILLLASRGDVEYVMDQVGHADAETTMRIYSQLLKRAKREHGKAFDSLVADARQTVLGTREGGSGGPFLSGHRRDWAHDWAQKAKIPDMLRRARTRTAQNMRICSQFSARPAGFEPATSRSGGERSIH